MILVTIRRTMQVRILAAVLSLGFAMAPSALSAACVAVDSHDLPRSCTATEKLGECMTNTQESLMQCREAGIGAWKCALAALVDDAACVLAAGVEVLTYPIFH